MFMLALRLGMPVARLLESLSAAEFRGWQKYHSVSPLDLDWRIDAGLAGISSTIANVNRGKGRKAYTVLEFQQFPYEEQKKPPSQTPAQLRARFSKRVKRGQG